MVRTKLIKPQSVGLLDDQISTDADFRKECRAVTWPTGEVNTLRQPEHVSTLRRQTAELINVKARKILQCPLCFKCLNHYLQVPNRSAHFLRDRPHLSN